VADCLFSQDVLNLARERDEKKQQLLNMFFFWICYRFIAFIIVSVDKKNPSFLPLSL
jgi:hypothetical protein